MADTTESRPGISDAEWCVMHEIWQSEPITSGEITARLSETCLLYTSPSPRD